MSFVFLLIFWFTSLRAGGPVPGPAGVGLDAGSGPRVPAVALGEARLRRPVQPPGQRSAPAADQQEATTSEEDSQDSEVCGGHPHAAFELLIVLGGSGPLGSSVDLVGQSRSPCLSPRLRC